jgi:type I restriction enzyme, S subunit
VQAKLRSFGQKTTNISNLNIERCRDLEIPLPALPEQRRIAAILDKAETLRSQRRAALAKLDSLTQSVFLEMFGVEGQGWPVETIAQIADAQSGSVRTGPFGSDLLHGEFVSEGVAVLGIDNAVSNEFRWGERRFITPAKYAELQRYTVKPGDVLITIMGTCGRCAVVPDDVPLAVNTKHLCCITLDTRKCVPAFLHAYFLQHPLARKYLEQTAKGAIMSGLNMGIIKAMPILIPPLHIQQTFAVRIHAIESLKVTHRTALAELDALFASLQHRAFNGDLTRSAAPVATTKARNFEELRRFDSEVGLEALIYAAKRMPGNDFYKTLKALYFADKHHLEQHGRLIYGETYCALPMGPVPQAAFDAAKVLSGELLVSSFPDDVLRAALSRTEKRLIPLRDADFGKLGAAERESLDWAIRYCAPMSFAQVKTASHDSAYDRTLPNAAISVADMVSMLPDRRIIYPE